MNVTIEVRSERVREQKRKGDKPSLFWQQVGLCSGDGFPVAFEIFRPDGDPLEVGEHEYDLRFRSGRFQSLEHDPFASRVLGD